MFGRGKKEELKKLEELKNQVIGNVQPQVQQIQQPVQIPSAPQPQLPAKPVDETPFMVVEKKVEQREKVEYLPSGQQIRTGQMETTSLLQPLYTLTFDDLIEIISKCNGKFATGMRMKLKNMMMSD